MYDYISREAALGAIKTAELGQEYEAVESIPAADVVEVVHGEWIEDISVLGTTTGGATVYRGYQCSICGGLMGRKGDSYCYRCGAKMDGGVSRD